MYYRKLLDQVLNFASQDSGSDFETMAKVEMNAVYHRVLETVAADMEVRTFTLTTVASTSKYGMPLYVRRVLNIEDTTNLRSIYSISRREFDQVYPGTTTSGTPSKCYPYGTYGVQKQPAAAGAVTVVSSSTADTGSNYVVTLTGMSSSVQTREKVTVTGTTAVTSSTSWDVANGIERIVKTPASGYTFAGNITVKDSSANTLAVIPTWLDSPEYQWVEFQPIPDAALTYNVRAEMRKMDLINNEDWPEFDQLYHDILVYGVTASLLPKVGQSGLADRHALIYAGRLKEFVARQQNRPTQIRTFSGIGTWVIGDRPGRPLIKNVDF